jgi:hypothetical protein
MIFVPEILVVNPDLIVEYVLERACGKEEISDRLLWSIM